MSSERTADTTREVKKIALVGFADSWKDAPFDDQTIDIFGLNELWKYVPRWDYWIEVHDDETLGVSKRDQMAEGEVKRHLEWLAKDHGTNRRGEKKPIFMQPQFCDGRFPNAVKFPIMELSEKWCPDGKPYFASSIGMMIAWAIDQQYDWIGLYGIDLASDQEYGHQRPNAEYFVGLARGLGKTVEIAKSSAICKAGHVYGYEKPLEANKALPHIREHKAKLQKKHEETLAVLNTLDGAMQECDNQIKLHEYLERGVTVTAY